MTSNLIRNGDFLDWPLGISFSIAGGTTSTTIAGDLSYIASGSSQPAVTIARQEHPVTSSVKQGFPRYFLRLTPATAPTLGASDKAYLRYQIVETIDRSVQGQYGTFTFWARCSTPTEVVVVALRTFGSGGQTAQGASQVIYKTSSVQLQKDWMKFQVDIPFNQIPGATYGSGSAVEIRIYTQGGSTELGLQQIGWRTGNLDFSQVSLTLRTVEDFSTTRLISSSSTSSVADFGAVGDGVTDDTAAIAAAYAALSATNGGELFFPAGKWKFNLIITKPNVTITGASHMRNTSGTPSFASSFIAANVNNPVLQVGDDTAIVRGTLIRNVSLDGSNGGTLGVYFAGGAFECTMENSAVVYFTTGIKVKGGTSFPASLIYFDHVHGHPNVSANGARGWFVANPSNYPTSYTSEVDLVGCHWDGPSSGTDSYVMEIDSVEVKLTNTYFDVTDGHGVKLSNSLGSTHLPFLDGVNSNIDSGLFSHIAIEGYDNSRNFNGLVAFNFQINGKWKELDGTLMEPPPSKLRRFALIHNPNIFGPLTLTNFADPNWLGGNYTAHQLYAGNDGIFLDTDAGVRVKTGTGLIRLEKTDTAGTGVTFRFVDFAGVTADITSLGGNINFPATCFFAQTLTIESSAIDGNCFLKFQDNLNNNTADIHTLDGELSVRVPDGKAFTVRNIVSNTLWFDINGVDGGTFLFGAGLNASTSLFLNSTKQIVSVPVTIIAAGTTGAQTINKPLGRVNFAGAAQTLVVTNSFVTTSSIIFAMVKTDDVTAKSVIVSAQSPGSFTLKLNAAATAETAVDFYVVNGA